MSYNGDELSGMELFNQEGGVEEGLAFEETQEEMEAFEKREEETFTTLDLIDERIEHYKPMLESCSSFDRYAVQMILKELNYIKEHL